MYFLKKHIWNIIFFISFCAVLFKMVPTWKNSFDQENKVFPEVNTVNLDGQPFKVPLKNKAAIYLFWATWCTPCHIQMDLFKSAVEEGELDGGRIFAITLNEPYKLVKSFQKEKQYPFKLLVSNKSFSDFNVMVTPSIAYVNSKGVIKRFSAGVSPFAVYKSKKFLN